MIDWPEAEWLESDGQRNLIGARCLDPLLRRLGDAGLGHVGEFVDGVAPEPAGALRQTGPASMSAPNVRTVHVCA